MTVLNFNSFVCSLVFVFSFFFFFLCLCVVVAAICLLLFLLFVLGSVCLFVFFSSLFSLATLHSLCALGSLARGQAPGLLGGRAKSRTPDSQRIPGHREY